MMGFFKVFLNFDLTFFVKDSEQDTIPTLSKISRPSIQNLITLKIYSYKRPQVIKKGSTKSDEVLSFMMS